MEEALWRNILVDLVLPTTQPVFHYTDAGAIRGMVEDRVLWLTEASAMNDPQEVTQGLEFINGWLRDQPHDDVIETLIKRTEQVESHGHSGVYLLCGSTAEDDINQWERYASGGGGYAVELDPACPLAIRHRRDYVPTAPRTGKMSLGQYASAVATVSPWVRVVYEDNDKDQLLAKFEQWVRSDTAEIDAYAVRLEDLGEGVSDPREDLWDQHIEMVLTGITALSQVMKSRGYRGENEVRVIATSLFNRHSYFRASRYGLAQYVEVVSRGDAALEGFALPYSTDQAALPIKSVMLGPLLSPRNMKTIKDLLSRNDLRKADVKTSSVPFR